MDTEWYNVNGHRAYPFLEREDRVLKYSVVGVTIPDSGILDAAVVIDARMDPCPSVVSGGRVRTSTAMHRPDVYLAEYSTGVSGGNHVVLTFRCSDSDSIGFTFTLTAADVRGTTRRVCAAAGATACPEHGVMNIVVGSFDDLFDADPLPLGNRHTYTGKLLLEPAAVLCRYRHHVRRIYIANDSIVVPPACGDPAVTPLHDADADGAVPEHCPHDEPADKVLCPEGRTIVVRQPAAGANTDHFHVPAGYTYSRGIVRFKPGFNTSVGINQSAGSMTITADLGATDGAGLSGDGPLMEPCRDDWDALETIKNGAPLDLSFNCMDLIYTINGVPPDASGNFAIYGGQGVGVSVVGMDSTWKGQYSEVATYALNDKVVYPGPSIDFYRCKNNGGCRGVPPKGHATSALYWEPFDMRISATPSLSVSNAECEIVKAVIEAESYHGNQAGYPFYTASSPATPSVFSDPDASGGLVAAPYKPAEWFAYPLALPAGVYAIWMRDSHDGPARNAVCYSVIRLTANNGSERLDAGNQAAIQAESSCAISDIRATGRYWWTPLTGAYAWPASVQPWSGGSSYVAGDIVKSGSKFDNIFYPYFVCTRPVGPGATDAPLIDHSLVWRPLNGKYINVPVDSECVIYLKKFGQHGLNRPGGSPTFGIDQLLITNNLGYTPTCAES